LAGARYILQAESRARLPKVTQPNELVDRRHVGLPRIPILRPRKHLKTVKLNSILPTRYPLEADEVPLCIRTLNLETSEHTHARTQLIVAGTAITRGEDLATRGCIYVFEIISVVPQPGRPETNRKLKLIAKEEVKGAVTALCEVGTQGFLLAAQGQKCMVRGLKEDGSLLPVAFMDMQCYVSVAKSLPGSGLIAFGDAVKNFWFAGFSVS
jgi:cleavage and polyadenylation specificity factor subunit 1